MKIIKVVSFLILLMLIGCTKTNELQDIFSCKEAFFSNLETITDQKQSFKISLPKQWNTNFYTDELQSSIYTADTTKQLTKTILLDIALFSNKIEINELFKLKLEQENLAEKRIQKNTKELTFLNKPSYFILAKGIKNKYNYQSLQLFIALNKKQSLIAKAEIYGDSLIEKRVCKAISLFNKILITEE